MKEMQVIWSDRALSDLLNISEVIENNFSNDMADKVIDDLIDYVESQLENNKEIGRTFELNPFYRYLVYKGNKIFYTPYESNDEIYIIHINARGANLQEL